MYKEKFRWDRLQSQTASSCIYHIFIYGPLSVFRPVIFLSSCHPVIFAERWAILYLSYIYLGSSVCLSSCHIPVILSSCHICGTLSYSLCLRIQTDGVDETEGFESEGYRWTDRRWTDQRGRVWIDFSLLKAQPKKNVGSQSHLQLLFWTI
jgi:hypothetical protein